MLKHIVLSQKKADKKKKCIETAVRKSYNYKSYVWLRSIQNHLINFFLAMQTDVKQGMPFHNSLLDHVLFTNFTNYAEVDAVNSTEMFWRFILKAKFTKGKLQLSLGSIAGNISNVVLCDFYLYLLFSL